MFVLSLLMFGCLLTANVLMFGFLLTANVLMFGCLLTANVLMFGCLLTANVLMFGCLLTANVCVIVVDVWLFVDCKCLFFKHFFLFLLEQLADTWCQHDNCKISLISLL